MRSNQTKRLLQAGRSALEEFCLGGRPLLAKVLGHTGFEWLLPMDQSLTARAREPKTERQTLLAQIAGLERPFASGPVAPSRMEAFC